MNITLSADEKVIAKARAAAAAQGTTLNELIRRYMEQLAGMSDRQAIADEFVRLCREGAGRAPEGWKFNREEIHERNFGK